MSHTHQADEDGYFEASDLNSLSSQSSSRKNFHPPVKNLKPKPKVSETTRKLNDYWTEKLREVEDMNQKTLRLATRTQELPLSRVKKVMKLDDQVKDQMISVDVPILMSKACEMLCERLTLAAWKVTEESKRKTLLKADIADAVAADEKLDFLVDIVPRNERQQEIELTEPSTSQSPSDDADPVDIYPAAVIDGRVYVEKEPGVYQVLQVSGESEASTSSEQ